MWYKWSSVLPVSIQSTVTIYCQLQFWGCAPAAVQLWAGTNTHLYLQGGTWGSPGQHSRLSVLGWAVYLFSSGVLGTVPGERSAPGFWGDGWTLKFLLGLLILWSAPESNQQQLLKKSTVRTGPATIMLLSSSFPACSNLQFKDFLSQELLAIFAFNSHWWTFLP